MNFIKTLLIDKKFRYPRIWSNRELAKFSDTFSGNIINVSGWKDEDKEGSEYKDYFPLKNTYTVSNFKPEARGYQGNIGEVYLDLESVLDEDLKHKFDVAFNHTVLEHVYDINMAVKNLCLLSKQFIVIVVPFIQEQHADYGDYWRFTPLAIRKLFEQNGKELIYINYNDSDKESIYIFAVAAGEGVEDTLKELVVNKDGNKINAIDQHMLGKRIIKNNIFSTISYYITNKFRKR